jgi:hypothetical protein
MDTMLEEVQQEETDQLNAHDRCDACGSQAYVYTEGVSGSLLWCRHHYLKHKDAISSWAFETIDETDKL